MTLCATILSVTVLFAAGEGNREWRFDFGPDDVDSPAGYVRVSPQTIFSPQQGWGWWLKEPRVRAFGPKGEASSPLLDGVEMTPDVAGEPPEFVVLMPNGRYVVSFLACVRWPQLHHVQGWAVELPYHRRPAYAWSELVVDVTDGRLSFSAAPVEPRRKWSANLLFVRPSTNDIEKPGPRQLFMDSNPREYGGLPVGRVIVEHSPTAVEDEQGITVDNGRLRVVVDRNGSGFIDEVWLDGEQIASTPEGWRGAFADIIQLTPNAGGVLGRNGLRGRVIPSKLSVDSIELTRRIWPVVIGITGHFLNGEIISGYHLELHIPRDKPYIVIHHRYDLTGNMDIEMLSSLGLSLPISIDERHSAFVQTRLAAPGRPDEVAGPDGWRLRTGAPGTMWRFGGLMQWSPGHAWNWKASRDDCRPIVTARGERSEGWIELCDWKWGVRAGIPGQELRTRAPKELLADASGRSLSILFWSPRARPLDLRGGDGKPLGIERGREAVHTAYLWFFKRGRPPDPMMRELIRADLKEGVLE